MISIWIRNQGPLSQKSIVQKLKEDQVEDFRPGPWRLDIWAKREVPGVPRGIWTGFPAELPAHRSIRVFGNRPEDRVNADEVRLKVHVHLKRV